MWSVYISSIWINLDNRVIVDLLKNFFTFLALTLLQWKWNLKVKSLISILISDAALEAKHVDFKELDTFYAQTFSLTTRLKIPKTTRQAHVKNLERPPRHSVATSEFKRLFFFWASLFILISRTVTYKPYIFLISTS